MAAHGERQGPGEEVSAGFREAAERGGYCERLPHRL